MISGTSIGVISVAARIATRTGERHGTPTVVSARVDVSTPPICLQSPRPTDSGYDTFARARKASAVPISQLG
jgi:hypothetical protein